MSGNSKPTQNDALSFELTDWPRPAIAAITEALGEE